MVKMRHPSLLISWLISVPPKRKTRFEQLQMGQILITNMPRSILRLRPTFPSSKVSHAQARDENMG